MFRSLPRLFISVVLLLVMLPLWAVEPIRIGVLNSPLKPWQPLATELKRQIPERDFVIEILGHAELEQAVASRRLDFVLTNPGQFLMIQRRSGLSSPLATLINNDQGHRLSVFGGAIICRAERVDIKDIKDVRGKTVAYVDFSAVGGFQAQAYELSAKGIDVQHDVHLLRLGAPHDKIVEAVLGGKADVGFVRAGLLEEMASKGQLDPARLRVLNLQDLSDFPWKASTHLYPEWAFASLPHADEFIARRVTAALLQLDRNPALVHLMKIEGFTVPADYQPVEDMLTALHLPPFDNALPFTIVDVWKKYRWQTIVVCVLLGLILLLALRLMIANRSLHSEQERVLLQSRLLAEAEERWRFALEGVGDGVWDWDVPNGTTKFSKRWKGMIGYREDEFADTFDAWAENLHPEDKQQILNRLQDYFDGKTPEYSVEFRMRCKDGAWKWILGRGMVVKRDTNGKPLRMIGTHTDISEHKQILDNLESLNRDFVTLLESTTDFIYFKDKDSRIRFCSQTLADITGHKSWRDMIGKHDLEIFPADTARIYYEEELPVFRDGTPILNRIDPYYDEQGRQGWVSTNKWPVFDSDGKTVNGIFGISRDISDYKRAEMALQESETRLRTIIENEPECIKIVDEQGNLVQMNPAGLAMIEATSLEQVAGRSILGIILPEYRDAFTQMLKRVIAGESIQMEFEIQGLKGTRRWLDSHSVPMLDHGKPMLLAVTRNITERKKAEEALRRSNADLERFAYSVSHDMRQPLRAISGHLQLLQRTLKDKLDENERENMGFALDGARRMDSMIVSLLDYSRVGRKTEAMQWMDSRASLDEAVGFLTPLIDEAKADVKISGEWPQVFGSRDELTRLFQNLIGNAIKFREAGQSVLVEVDSTVQKETWRVSVRDYGIGIDAQQIDRLFQFFSRLQSRVRFEGTGMGLALCRRIVEHHGGRIWAESAGEGKGSMFLFEMPLKKV